MVARSTARFRLHGEAWMRGARACKCASVRPSPSVDYDSLGSFRAATLTLRQSVHRVRKGYKPPDGNAFNGSITLGPAPCFFP
jgi:hypothetical protein